MYVMKTDLEACEPVAAALKHFYPFYASPPHRPTSKKVFCRLELEFLYINQRGQKSSGELVPPYQEWAGYICVSDPEVIL